MALRLGFTGTAPESGTRTPSLTVGQPAGPTRTGSLRLGGLPGPGQPVLRALEPCGAALRSATVRRIPIATPRGSLGVDVDRLRLVGRVGALQVRGGNEDAVGAADGGEVRDGDADVVAGAAEHVAELVLGEALADVAIGEAPREQVGELRLVGVLGDGAVVGGEARRDGGGVVRGVAPVDGAEHGGEGDALGVAGGRARGLLALAEAVVGEDLAVADLDVVAVGVAEEVLDDGGRRGVEVGLELAGAGFGGIGDGDALFELDAEIGELLEDRRDVIRFKGNVAYLQVVSCEEIPYNEKNPGCCKP